MALRWSPSLRGVLDHAMFYGRFVPVSPVCPLPFLSSSSIACVDFSIWLLLPLLASGLFLFAYPQPSDAARGGAAQVAGKLSVSAPSFVPRGAGNFAVALGVAVDSAVGGIRDSRPLFPDVRIRRRRPVRLFLDPDDDRRVLVNALRGRGGAGAVGGALPSANWRPAMSPSRWPGGGASCRLACLANAPSCSRICAGWPKRPTPPTAPAAEGAAAKLA